MGLEGLTHELGLHRSAALSLEFGNALFYLAGFLAPSTFIGRLLYCRGSVGSVVRADVAFGTFEFLLWATSRFLAGKDFSRRGFRRRLNNTQAS